MTDPRLRADCASCFALCCVVPAFAASADFAIDKRAGEPCPNLQPDFRCGVHATLREQGFRGCTVYDCFGAGQQVSQVTFGGHDWRSAPASARKMFRVFPVVRAANELRWYLTEALALDSTRPLHPELSAALRRCEQLVAGTAATLLAVDVDGCRREVNAVLAAASELARAGVTPRRDHRGADLVGARLRGADLRGASLRGALLIGADLRQADLRLADVTGADCRGADLRGADLSTSLFLTQAQLDSARGDAATALPPSLANPASWGERA